MKDDRDTEGYLLCSALKIFKNNCSKSASFSSDEFLFFGFKCCFSVCCIKQAWSNKILLLRHNKEPVVKCVIATTALQK